jgi:polyphosphate kinase
MAARQRKAAAKASGLDNPELYSNRELSQIEFNQRVLDQAKDVRLPLLERLRYLCISCTNLDEFFEIRVATIREQLQMGFTPGADGLGPHELLRRVRQRAEALVEDQYRTWNEVLQPALLKENIRFIPRDLWTPAQRNWLHEYFLSQTLPVLSPLGLDPAHPFPRILNKTLNIAVLLRGKDAFGREGNAAIVRAPRSLPRLIQLPTSVGEGPHSFVFLASLLHEFADEMFPGMEVRGSYQFRVTRNSELLLEEDGTDFARAVAGELHERHYQPAVRLEVGENTPKETTKYLLERFELSEAELYRCAGPVNINRLSTAIDLIDRPDLKFKPFKPRVQRVLQSEDLFSVVRKQDVLLHHPFDSFGTVLELLRQASTDPDVLAIKQTLYRTGKLSLMVNYLIDAARSGKDVTVVVELRARFDEEANLALALRLQEAGVQVVYGVVDYKTHAKMLLIVRRERDSLRRYAHLGTGNYHQGTAAVYTDIGLITADAVMTEDVHKVFQQMSGLAPVINLKRLLHSPFTLYKAIVAKIDREASHAAAGKTARIIARMNALNEAGVIQALYKASQAGVQIDLIVRGACALRPGIAGVSENIRVRSIVGRFLEHSRVFYFENAGAPELYGASADWLDRNLHRRVEVAFPILDGDIFERVKEETLDAYLADNTQAWLMQSDGSYLPSDPGRAAPQAAQAQLLKQLCKA